MDRLFGVVPGPHISKVRVLIPAGVILRRQREDTRQAELVPTRVVSLHGKLLFTQRTREAERRHGIR
jgi:hypothetical protein